MKIIYLSGIDGCGKTTQAKLLVDALKQKGVDARYVWLRWEPSFQKIIHVIRSILVGAHSDKIIKYDLTVATLIENESKWLLLKKKILSNFMIRNLWLFFACADYYLAYKKRFKNLCAEVVVIDRFIHDFMIDQSINIGLPPEKMDQVKHNIFLRKFHLPDYKLIIDISTLEGSLRKSDGTSTRYLNIREPFYRTISGTDTLHLDGMESIIVLHDKIKNWVFQKIGVNL